MGFMVLQALAQEMGVVLKKSSKLECLYAQKETPQGVIHLVLPQTYMNESGSAVDKYLDYYKRHINELVVVVDDMDLRFSRLRLRESGSSGGHNGLKSIEQHLG